MAYRDPEKAKANKRKYHASAKGKAALKRGRDKYKGDKANRRKIFLKDKYGITMEEWYSIFDNQNHSCAICKTTNPGSQWQTDHDHATGEVRGLLCRNCNLGLGFFRDSDVILQSVREYLCK